MLEKKTKEEELDISDFALKMMKKVKVWECSKIELILITTQTLSHIKVILELIIRLT